MSFQQLPFLDVFKDATGGNIKTPRKEFLKEGEFPVVDQGQVLVAGFVNDRSRVCNVIPPVIVFGDHTRAIKYVDFAFAMGADGTKVLVPKVESDTKYLYYALKALKIPAAGYSRHYKFLKETQIPLPPLAEQERIAGILDAADALRAKRRKALAQLDTLLQSIFLDMFGDPVTNPMGWDAPPLADFCKTGSGGTPSRKKMQRYYEGGTIPWVKSGELREEVISSTSEYITQAALKETNVKLVPKDALMLALYGATVGRLGILGTQATTNQAVCHIIPNASRADFRYMFHCLSNQVSYLVGRGVGGAQPNISQGLVKSLTIPLPPLNLQHGFATIVKSVEQQKAHQQAHLAELNALFASLQSRAFRGDL